MIRLARILKNPFLATLGEMFGNNTWEPQYVYSVYSSSSIYNAQSNY